MRPYVIRQGEHLSQLAARFGFVADEVWQHADNRELRELRGSPNVLAPGDILHIPDQPASGPSVQKGGSHSFRGVVPRVPVRVTLRLDGQPIANERCLVSSIDPPLETQTDGSGVLSFEAPAHMRSVDVELPEQHRRLHLRIGHLDPVGEGSGVRDRLVNLGYLSRAYVHDNPEQREEATQRALEAFQRDNDLEPTGTVDDATRDALRDGHGA